MYVCVASTVRTYVPPLIAMPYNHPRISLWCAQVNISPRERVGGADGFDTRGLKENDATDLVVKKMLRQQAQTQLAGGRLQDSLNGGKTPDFTNDGVVTNIGNDHGQIVNPPRARDLCLGMASGVNAAQLVTFAGSFREVSPLADLVIFFEAPTNTRFKAIIDK